MPAYESSSFETPSIGGALRAAQADEGATGRDGHEAPHARDWPEPELVMISALQHWSYCPRQCGLIHLEQTFDENLYTLRGRRVHERVDTPESRLEEGVRVERALPLFCDRLGLVGKADLVEIRDGVPLPVEYKHGPRKNWGHDDLQLCAQALCLEEMTGHGVPRGAIFQHGSRRRRMVEFVPELRERVERAVADVREMLIRQNLPPAPNDARCPNCSLIQSCLPSVVAESRCVRRVVAGLFAAGAE